MTNLSSKQETGYARILKSSSIVGGAQGFNMLLGMVRVKFVAVLLGPSGLGLLGMLQSLLAMTGAVTGLGINQSGVRDVAEASGANDAERISRIVVTLRRLCWLTGIVGAIILFVFAKPLSVLSFQTPEYSQEIAWVSVVVLMAAVSAGQMTLLQGMRRIGDLARVSFISAIAGTCVAIFFYTWLGVAGIVPALITMAAFSLVCSFWFSRKISVQKVQINWKETFSLGGGLVSMGLAFMWSGLMTMVAEYVIRMMITHQLSLGAVGIFAAAFRLSGMFLNFVLGAMAADYYPALTAVADDHEKMRSMVNQQTEIGLLLAVPGLLATMVLAPWVIQVFYTSEFIHAASLLQWFVLGCFVRVITWPMGFVMKAMGKGMLFAWLQTVVNTLHIIFVWFGLKWFGIEGVAIAFFALCFQHVFWVKTISWKLIKFRWSSEVWKLLVFVIPVIVIAFFVGRYTSTLIATSAGLLITVCVSWWSLKSLCLRLDAGHRVVRFCQKFRFLKLA